MSETLKPELEFSEQNKFIFFDNCFMELYNKKDESFNDKLQNCIHNMSESYKILLNNYNQRIPEYDIPVINNTEEEEDEDDE